MRREIAAVTTPARIIRRPALIMFFLAVLPRKTPRTNSTPRAMAVALMVIEDMGLARVGPVNYYCQHMQ